MRARLALAALVVLGSAVSTGLIAQPKKRVAVARFEDRTGSGYHSLGDGVADMLATALVKSGKFMVLDRQEIQRVIDEQQFGQTFMVTPESAPKVGQIVGVELFAVGSVTEFGTKESSIGGATSLFGGSVSTRTARAVIDIRLVNTSTGEIVAAETMEGSKSTTGFSVALSEIDFGNTSAWNDTDIGKATREAVDGCVKLIMDNIASIPWSGKVLRVYADGTLLMKPGSEGNVKKGMSFGVFRKGEEVKDPDTGLSLGAEEEKVGTITVVEDALSGKAAKVKVVSGSGFQVGDIIKEE